MPISLYRRSLVVDTALSPEDLRDRIRFMVEKRLLPKTRRFRLRQIAGWAYKEREAGFMLRPDPSSADGITGPYFLGRIEADGCGSRIVGFVREYWLTQVIATALMVGMVAMTVAALRENSWMFSREVARVVAFTSIMVAVCLLLVRFNLRTNEKMIRDGITLALSLCPQDRQ